MNSYQLAGFPFWLTFLAATVLYRTYRGAFFFLAAFPGTVAHELAHYLTALVLRGQPRPINLVPTKVEGGWALGSVTFVPNYFNGSFVAMAPLLLLPAAWVIARHAGALSWHTQLWVGYCAGCLVNSAVPSSADWKIVRDYPLGFFIVLLVIAGLWHMRNMGG
jgi:hypothetical protein